MVARSSRAVLVPFTVLQGASCLLPERRRVRVAVEPESAAPASWLGTAGPTSGTPAMTVLTPAECRVCELMLEGLANKEIASALDRAEATIKNQVAAVLRKHGVPSRMRLMALYR